MNRILAIALLLVFPVAAAQGTNIWLSTESAIPPGSAAGEVPDIHHVGPGEAGQLHIWLRPDSEKNFTDFSLNVRSTNEAVIDFTQVALNNPVLWEVAGFTRSRFQVTYDSDDGLPIETNPDAINGIMGFSIFPQGDDGWGMGPKAVRFGDPFYDAVNDAFLLATVDYVTTGAGSTDLFLQIGEWGVNNDGERSTENWVVFGDLSDPPLNGENDREQDSATADASITVMIPEPSSLLLVVVAAFGVLATLGVRWPECARA